MTFELADLKQGSNIMEWFIILNNSYGGHPIGIAFILAISIIFAVMISSNVKYLQAAIATSFLGFLITGLLWVARFEGQSLIPTFYPVLFIFLLGLSIILKITENVLKN